MSFIGDNDEANLRYTWMMFQQQNYSLNFCWVSFTFCVN
jgi:hypothetical protein